jgi:hypothetical protein
MGWILSRVTATISQTQFFRLAVLARRLKNEIGRSVETIALRR